MDNNFCRTRQFLPRPIHSNKNDSFLYKKIKILSSVIHKFSVVIGLISELARYVLNKRYKCNYWNPYEQQT